MKGQTKLLKQREIKEDTKTYEQVCKDFELEVEEMINATAPTWIEKFCNALKHDHPDWNKIQIRAKVIKDWARPKGSKKAGWTETTIRNNWPEWMIYQKLSEAQKTRYNEGRMPQLNRKSSISESKLSREEQEKDEEQAPISSQAIWDYEETHPKTELTPFQALGEINRAIARLWTALTGNPNMAHMEDDIKKEHVIPTRERFKDIVNGSSKVERDFLFNWLTWLDTVIHDRLAIVEKADKTAYDTRE